MIPDGKSNSIYILQLLFFVFQGSTLIVVDVLRRKSGKRFTTYRQLVLGMSFFDCISSVSHALATSVAPIDSGLYQARGNDATCKAQGVLIQLGLSSMLYNMLVSIYFWLVICHNWKEHDFRRIRLWAHVVICGAGAALAFAAIPYVGANLAVCSLLIPPSTPTLWPATIFFTIPLSCVVLISSLATGAVCWNVYMQQKTVQKWMANRNMDLTKKVFWQSFWYVIAFYVTIPWLLLNFYAEYRSSSTEVWVRRFFVAISSPSQGLLNSLVYFQRQQGWVRCRGCVKRSLGKKQLNSSNASTAIGGKMDSKDPSSASNVDEWVDGMEPYEEERVVEREGRESQEGSKVTIEVEQQSSGGNIEVDDEEARQRNDSPVRELSAVAEYWELNEEYEEYDNRDNSERRSGGLFRGVRASLADLRIGRVLDTESSN